jgi:hypothetical protein
MASSSAGLGRRKRGTGKGVQSMRRVFGAMVAAGLATGAMASPPLASSQSHHRFSGTAVVAVWHSKTRVSPGRFKLTTWFVGVFPSPSGTASQVVKEVDKCTVVSRHRQCRIVSVSAGFRKGLTAAQFTFDRKHLEAAHLDATYRLRQLVPRKPGSTSRVTIAATWTGSGKISRSESVDNFHSGCLRFHDTFHGRTRSATATGSVDGKSLATTTDAFLSASTDVLVEHRC